MHNFDFTKPSSIADAVKALSKPGAQALSGGQTLIPTLKSRLADADILVSLTGIAEMKGVCRNGDHLAIGGATSHAQVAKDAAKDFPALADLAGHIGDPAVRNRGTIGGSLANNDPAACYPAAVLGTGAIVVTNKREIAADDFFEGMFATALEEGEIITGINFPIPAKAAYVKFNQPASRFALTGVFVSQGANGVRVAITGASESGVFRWKEAEAALTKDFSAKAIEALSLPEDGMISDLHGTSAYRAHLAKVLTARAVASAQ